MSDRARVRVGVWAASHDDPNCEDDPTYTFVAGLDNDNNTVTWKCADWHGFFCEAGGWGTDQEDDIIKLLTSCPVACVDGRCHPQPHQPRVTNVPHVMVKRHAQCAVDMPPLQHFPGMNATMTIEANLQLCADACASAWRCEFFGFSAEKGDCYHMRTNTMYCDEGWVYAPQYNFYRLTDWKPPSPPPPSPDAPPPPLGPPPPPPGTLLKDHEVALVATGPLLVAGVIGLAVVFGLRWVYLHRHKALKQLWDSQRTDPRSEDPAHCSSRSFEGEMATAP